MTFTDVRNTKKLLKSPVTEQVKVNWYVRRSIFGWALTLVVLIISLFGTIGFYDLGLRGISLNYSGWFNVVMISSIMFVQQLAQAAFVFLGRDNIEMKVEML